VKEAKLLLPVLSAKNAAMGVELLAIIKFNWILAFSNDSLSDCISDDSEVDENGDFQFCEACESP